MFRARARVLGRSSWRARSGRCQERSGRRRGRCCPVWGRTDARGRSPSASTRRGISSPMIVVCCLHLRVFRRWLRRLDAPSRLPPQAVGQVTTPGPAGDGGEVSVQAGVELEGGGGLARSLADLERKLPAGDRIGARRQRRSDDRSRPSPRRSPRAVSVLADVQEGSDRGRVELGPAQLRSQRDAHDQGRQVADGGHQLWSWSAVTTWPARVATGDPGPTVISAVIAPAVSAAKIASLSRRCRPRADWR